MTVADALSISDAASATQLDAMRRNLEAIDHKIAIHRDRVGERRETETGHGGG